MDFGFTNDDARYEAAVAYRIAAAADGWDMKPSYGTEPVERAARLTRDGWMIQIISRTKVGKWKYEAQVCAWGPDRLAVNPSTIYDFAQLQAQLTTCHECGKTDVPTERVGFAGRVCSKCLPKARTEHEYPGWCD